MDQYVSEEERLPTYACFRHLFEKYTAGVRQLLNVQRVKITDYDGNEGLPLLSWCGDPIEILYVDCGRTYAANEAWYNHLKSSFIPGLTLIVMQDWGTHRVAARVVEMKTKIEIHLPTSAPDQSIFRLVLGRLPRLVT